MPGNRIIRDPLLTLTSEIDVRSHVGNQGENLTPISASSEDRK
jgi:hypothetical protein